MGDEQRVGAAGDSLPAPPLAPAAPTAPEAKALVAPRPSGLKPPTKIGRLCASSAPKPAVPISPRADSSSNDTLRKYSEDHCRKHLADLVEADEETDATGAMPYDRLARVQRKASTSSTYSLASMEALWEKHPRRLSEAGLRRSSDHSVVLTEDTDSFIIGDRVWVGGSKPGQIAYIGETQFAPGEWAGIVLDDPIGKNDGSVAGTRYFQCAERRGVFSRLTRLTRLPLVAPHAASPASDAGSLAGERPRSVVRGRRSGSPVGSVRSVFSSKMNSSINSSYASGELKLGERVIVSSSQGSKAGTLRYVGPTEFANGTWCGVELDDPIGKNDGSVEGKRYFECGPRFGLFAPASKVSRSPSSRKPGACAVHSRNGAATPVRRSVSRESLTSLGTSLASSVRTAPRPAVRLGITSLAGAQRMSGPRASSTPVSAKSTLQELLREKQQHLERLIKERELERAEVAKVTMQADRVESALAIAKKESAHAHNENQKLKAQLQALNQQLEDERQKVEDLLFRTEEDNINKEDFNKYKESIEVSNENQATLCAHSLHEAYEAEKAVAERKILELESEVALLAATAEAARATVAAIDERHAAELEAVAAQHREELQAAQMLSAELQKLLDEAYALLKEKECEKDSLGKSMTEEISKIRAESDKAVSEIKSKLAVSQTEFEAQLSVVNAKLQAAESRLVTEKQNTERLAKENSDIITELTTKLSQVQAASDDKTQELHKALATSKELELSLTKDLTKLKMDLSAKVLDLEEVTGINKKYEQNIKNLHYEMSNIKEEYSKKMTEYESLLNDTSTQNDKFSAEIIDLQQIVVMKTGELEKFLNDSRNTSAISDKLVLEYKEAISERDKEIIKLKQDVETTNETYSKNQASILEEHKKEIEEKNMTITQLMGEIDEQKQLFENNKQDLEVLMAKVNSNLDEIKVLTSENAQLKASLAEVTKTNGELSAKIASMELETGDLKRSLQSTEEKCAELLKMKEKLEGDITSLSSHSTDSNEQLRNLTQNLRERENELQSLKDAHRDKVNQQERIEQELKQKLEKLQQEFKSEKENLVEKINSTNDQLKEAESRNNELNLQIKMIQDNASKNISDLQKEIENEKNVLLKNIESYKTVEVELRALLQSAQSEHDKTISDLNKKLEALKEGGKSSEANLKEKVDQLMEAQNDLNRKLEAARNNEELLQKNIVELTTQTTSDKAALNQEIANKEVQLNAFKEEIKTIAVEDAKHKAISEEKENIIKELTYKYAILEVDVKANLDIIAEKDRQVNVLNEELNKTLNDKHVLEEQLNASNIEVKNIQQKVDLLYSDKSGSETVFKEQQEQIGLLKTQLATSNQEKTKVEDLYKVQTEVLSKLTNEHSALLKNFEKSAQKINELTESIKTYEESGKIQLEKLNAFEATINDMEQFKQQHTKALQEKNEYIDKCKLEVKQLQKSNDTNNKEVLLQIENYKVEIAQLKQTHREKVDILTKNLSALESTNKEYEKTQQELVESKEKLTDLTKLVEKLEADIKQLTNINDGQKANYEDLNKQLQADYEKLKKEFKKERHSQKDSVEAFEKALKESNSKTEQDQAKINELNAKLTEATKTSQELTNQVELLTVHQQKTSNDQDGLLEKLTLELQSVRKNHSEAITSKDDQVNKLRLTCENKANEAMIIKDQNVKLQDEVTKYKAKAEIAEREKVMMQKEFAKKEMTKDNLSHGDNNNIVNKQDDTSTLKLLEEKQLVEGQVDFLNSVIVDMQRKNEQLLARVQALETGFSVQEVDEMNFNGLKSRTVAPRLFCDICDIFDAHDTEDCPRQAGSQDSPPPPTTSSRKAPPPPRPYCEVCEVFGHATENCEEEETY